MEVPQRGNTVSEVIDIISQDSCSVADAEEMRTAVAPALSLMEYNKLVLLARDDRGTCNEKVCVLGGGGGSEKDEDSR